MGNGSYELGNYQQSAFSTSDALGGMGIYQKIANESYGESLDSGNKHGAVEALKDQGFCRWNYTMRSLHQHAKNNLRSFSQAKKLSSSSSAMASSRVREEKAKQSESP
ncbi:hypothetical protein CK203_097929 [Vitis vinifera]|uniref:Uncharacterized protein n=1 Tax=Vitis vinifera TaxID=29760 RepID=A0A438DQA5_VITVI|nr:hypothetical protein CK203_097929 [Vitis vinifera]